MKVHKTAGLVGAGGVSRSFLARMPALLARLGPVKGSSFQVSRRIANGLRAGLGVPSFQALQECDLIWIAVPEDTLDAVTQELAAEIRLAGKVVVLCDALRDSLWPSPLRTAGARLASLNCVPASKERTFAAEGHPSAIAELRRLLAMDGRKLIALRVASKPLYLSGVYLGVHALLPWIAGAVESLRAAGFPRAEAMRTVQALGARALRAYAKAGDKSWNRAAAESLLRAIERDLHAIRLTDPRRALLYSDGAGCIGRFFRERQKAVGVNSKSLSIPDFR
jgi:hypothetical protein